MKSIRLVLALVVGKTAISTSKLFGKKGTSLPGKIALKIYPEFIKTMSAKHKKLIAITGTNGKTTTSNLLAAILHQEGKKFTHNAAGANMVSGIATAFIETGRIGRNPVSDIAVIEIDEATMPLAIPSLQPDIVVVTNFFRDQLDRYGELDKTIDLTVGAIKDLTRTKIILNADDPLVATIGQKVKLPVTYYGVAKNQYSTVKTTQMVEGRYCPFCQGQYQYQYYHYGQLGGYTCPQCGFDRPTPDYLVEAVELNSAINFTVNSKGHRENYKLRLEGLYNLYNALAAVTAASEFGIDTETIKAGLEQYAPKAGRMEKFNIKGRETTLALVKNPTGFNEVLKTVINFNGSKSLVLAINDLYADGEDVSWLWDVDFEVLNDNSVDLVVCSGLRAEDMAVRLKYAGLPVEKIKVIKSLKEAIGTGIEKSNPRNTISVLPTYTNLFAAEDILKSMAGNMPMVKVGGRE